MVGEPLVIKQGQPENRGIIKLYDFLTPRPSIFVDGVFLIKGIKMTRKVYFNDTDKTIAKHIKLRRIMLGMTQSDLAKSCGISFQQIQKYEATSNKISASRLFQISQALKVPMNFFFENTNKMYDTKSLELVILYWKLPEKLRKDLILKLMKSIK